MPDFNFVLLQSEGFMTIRKWKWKKFFESLKKFINPRSQEF